jgi:plastocyanin
MTRRRAVMMITAAMLCGLGGDARAQEPGKARAGGRGPTAAEFAALKHRVDQQNDLIMRLTQLEGEHYEMLLKWLQTTGRMPGGAAPSLVPHPTSAPPPAPPAAMAPPDGDVSTAVAAARPKLATITGRVDVKGKSWGPTYVYVENVKEPAVDRNVEIMQKDRAFVPNVLLVQRGTRITFPNADPFLHNVFSPSPTQPFDLGSYKQGEKAGSVRLFAPGVVEVLCNMHAKMRANVLVVPSRHHVKVNADGSFRLENVPVGTRQVVAWTPDARPMTQSVALTAAGASVGFALQVEGAPPPMDKMGKPRAPYRSDE